MNNIVRKNLFQWTLRGKPYWMLSSGALSLLILVLGVMSYE